MSKYHVVGNLRFLDDTMAVTIDGRECSYPLAAISDALVKASAKERSAFEISSSGYGIHWPLLDEDLSVDGLLGIVHSPDRQPQQEPRA